MTKRTGYLTIMGQLSEPIFQITNLRKLLWEVYSLLGAGFALGLLVGAVLWR